MDTEITILEDLGMLYPTKTSKQKARYGLYKCFCGTKFKAKVSHIKDGGIKSCGCLRGTPHNLSKHRLYKIWREMIRRCHNPKSSAYKYYGARGTIVCEKWHNLEAFIMDMYPSFQEGLTLDRENNELGYNKENCRWVDKTIQSRNTREIRNNNSSGYRGVSFHKGKNKWSANIRINTKLKYLGDFNTALEAAKAYETYILLNKLEHNYTSVLSEEEKIKICEDWLSKN